MPFRKALVLVVVLASGTVLGSGCFLSPNPWPPHTTTTTTTAPATTTTTTTAPETTTTTSTTTTTEPPETTTQPAPSPCAPGSFNATTGSEPCTPAPPGYFVDAPGALQATPCSKGTYQPAAGQVSCPQAPIGSYVDVTAATAATACPALTTTAAAGSDSASDCVGLVPASLVFSNGQDSTHSNFGYLDGAGLKPGAQVTACGDQFVCQDAGVTPSATGVIAHVGAIFSALPCKTNIYFTTLAADGSTVTSNTASYPPGTPGCP